MQTFHTELRNLIDYHFSLDELRILCFDLNVDYEHIKGDEKRTKIVNLILYFERNEQLSKLIARCNNLHPGTNWPQISSDSHGNSTEGINNAPPLPPHFMTREADLVALKVKILQHTTKPIAVTGQKQPISLQGMGGLGKSVMAIEIAHDLEVRNLFPDGIFWFTLGQTPNIPALQAQLGQLVGSNPKEFGIKEIEDNQDEKEIRQRSKILLQKLLIHKKCLLILDDVWQKNHLDAFDILNTQSRMLITTRDASLATSLDAIEHCLDTLNSEQAMLLLSDWTGQSSTELPNTAYDVANECGYLPLALTLCGAQVRDGVPWHDLLIALREADLPFLDHPHQGSVMKSIQFSLDTLSMELRNCYLSLVVFPEDTLIPENVLLQYWGELYQLPARTGRKIITDLERKALIRTAGESPARQISLHDLQRLYLVNKVDNIAYLHDALLNSYYKKYPTGWSESIDDGYFFQNLPHHRRKPRYGYVDLFLRSLLNYTFAVILLIMIIPIMLISAILIKLDSPGPMIYRRRVFGKNGRAFDAYKFRTIYVNGDAILAQYPKLREALNQNYKLKLDPRVTRIGRLLRKFSLDELPQITNVLRGEMNMIGPRIVSTEELALYGDYGKALLIISPGITGLWQASSLYPSSLNKRIRLDMHYIYNQSIWLDLKIALRTFSIILRESSFY